ncbi:MAG TPA: glycosyltransferase [Chloroflexia bacterium]|nr:glycosyltransferase [Chloroflexia bacterium]
MPRRVRLLQVIDHLGNGGAEVLQLTLAKGIDRARFDLHVIALRRASGPRLTPSLRALGVPATELKQRNAYDIPALLSIVKYIHKHRIDIIHTHLLAADFMGRIAGFLTGRPVVSTIHNSRADLDNEPVRRQWMEQWTGRFIARRLIVVSELLREETAQWFGVPLGKVTTIPNGVDTESFRRGPEFDRAAVKRDMVGDGEYVMVTNLARWVPQKGLNHLIDAARIVTDARPDVRFLLLGHGDLHAELEAQADALGIGDKVIFGGFLDNVSDVLAASDVFVLSSLWEGLPLALLEAMAAGCPAVATDVGGVSQVLQRGATGLLVPPADASALAAAILECANNPEQAKERGTAAQAWVTQRYGMRAWAGKLEGLYLRVLARR